MATKGIAARQTANIAGELGGKSGKIISKEVKVAEQAGESLLKRGAKFAGERIIKSLPAAGAIFTLFTSDAPWGERVARAAAGEIGVGPFDLEMCYDASIWVYETAQEDAKRVRIPKELEQTAEQQKQDRMDVMMFKAKFI